MDAAGETAHKAAQRGGLAVRGIGQGDGDIHLRDAALQRDAAAAADKSADTEGIRRAGHIHIGKVDGTGNGEIPERSILRRAEKAQGRGFRQLIDAQAGNGAALSVQRAGKGRGRTDDGPGLEAKVDVRRYHGVVGLPRPAVHSLSQPGQLLRGADAVGVGGSTAAAGLLNGDAVPVAGAVQQVLDAGAGGVIGRLHIGSGRLQRFSHGDVIGQDGKVPVRRCTDSGGGISQHRCQPLAAGSGILHQIAGQIGKGGDTAVRQFGQALPRPGAGQLQRQRGGSVHIRRSIGRLECKGQLGQGLTGVGIQGVYRLYRDGAFHLQAPVLIGAQQRGHVLQ